MNYFPFQNLPTFCHLLGVIALFTSAMTLCKTKSKQNESFIWALLMDYVHISHFEAHVWYETNITLASTLVTRHIFKQHHYSLNCQPNVFKLTFDQ